MSISTILAFTRVPLTCYSRFGWVGAREGCQSATPVRFWAGRRISPRGEPVVFGAGEPRWSCLGRFLRGAGGWELDVGELARTGKT